MGKKKDILKILHRQGKKRRKNMPAFDVEKTLKEAKKKEEK